MKKSTVVAMKNAPRFVDDSHVKMITPEGDYQVVELSQAGLYAYQQIATASTFAMK